MAGRGPTLINLPPPLSDPTTPSEMGPGTPNSTTTSLSTLSVVAIKDGAVGHGGRGSHSHTSAGTLEAERADRISRLAGLERVSTVRAPGQSNTQQAGTTSGHLNPYFDSTAPQAKERSTVGSASATGSVGGRTTWASGSVVTRDEDDAMSESTTPMDQDDGIDASSAGGLSDEGNASLVAFGEGAGSTVSGPVSSAQQRAIGMRARQGYIGSPTTPRSAGTPTLGSGTAMGMGGGGVGGSAVGSTDPKMMDGITYDRDVVDTTMGDAPPPQPRTLRGHGGAELAESIMRDRITDTEPGRRVMGAPEIGNIGRFPFERD